MSEEAPAPKATNPIESEVLDWLGLLPTSEAPNEEPDYEARLRRLGAHFRVKGLTGPELLAALALDVCAVAEPTAYDVGMARILATSARNLLALDASAEDVGAGLMREFSSAL